MMDEHTDSLDAAEQQMARDALRRRTSNVRLTVPNQPAWMLDQARRRRESNRVRWAVFVIGVPLIAWITVLLGEWLTR